VAEQNSDNKANKYKEREGQLKYHFLCNSNLHIFHYVLSQPLLMWKDTFV